ncbi:MAG TPA: hypothetical protein VLX92_14480 [Kofleriaceae bacterium]|nr:hypothetical protein [Kofleriaceae bacterium]
MRSLRVAVIAVLAACGDDPTLHVTVQHPAGLMVASTTITDYESPTLSCDDIEFSRPSADELAALAVTDETIDDATGKAAGGLTGMSRTANKVIVARGLDQNGTMIAEGCGSVGVVNDDTSITIATNVAATVSIAAPQSDGTGSASNDVAVAVTDPYGAPLDKRPVSWTVYAPAGTQPATTGTVTVVSDGVWQPAMPSCTAAGTLHIHPVFPALVGGYAVQIRVAWAQQQPPLYTGLLAPPFKNPTTLSSPPPRDCAPRASGATLRLTCVDGSAQVHDYQVTPNMGVGTLTDEQSPMTLGDVPVAVFSFPVGIDRDAYAMSAKGVISSLDNMVTIDDSPLHGSVGAPCIGGTCSDAIAIPSCGTTSAKVGVTNGMDVWELDVSNGQLTDLQLAAPSGETTLELNSAGCVTVLDAAGGMPTLRQILALRWGHTLSLGTVSVFVPAETHLYYLCGTAVCSIQLPVESGVAFTTGTEPRLISTTVDATGVVVVQDVMTTLATARPFVERARYPATSIPDRMVVGQFDTDSTTDLLWSMTNRAQTATTFEVAYARTVGDDPLESLSGQVPIELDDLLAFDLTGDGIDDLIVTGKFPLGAGVVQGIQVIPTDTAIPSSNMPDQTCAP